MLISSIIGDDLRSTKDIDATWKFTIRNTTLIINEIIQQIENIKAEKRLQILWENYHQNVATYSKGIKFEELFDALEYSQ